MTYRNPIGLLQCVGDVLIEGLTSIILEHLVEVKCDAGAKRVSSLGGSLGVCDFINIFQRSSGHLGLDDISHVCLALSEWRFPYNSKASLLPWGQQALWLFMVFNAFAWVVLATARAYGTASGSAYGLLLFSFLFLAFFFLELHNCVYSIFTRSRSRFTVSSTFLALVSCCVHAKGTAQESCTLKLPP